MLPRAARRGLYACGFAMETMVAGVHCGAQGSTPIVYDLPDADALGASNAADSDGGARPDATGPGSGPTRAADSGAQGVLFRSVRDASVVVPDDAGAPDASNGPVFPPPPL